MGSLIVLKVDTSDMQCNTVTGKGPIPQDYLQDRAKELKDALSTILEEDFDVIAIDSRDSLEILSDGRLRELGLKRSKSESPKPVDSKGAEIPYDVQLLLEDRQAAMNRGDYNRCMELRDEIRISGYEVEDTAKGPKLVKK